MNEIHSEATHHSNNNLVFSIYVYVSVEFFRFSAISQVPFFPYLLKPNEMKPARKGRE